MNFKSILKKAIPNKYQPILTEIRASLISLLYFGNQQICPCCNGHYRKFLAYGISRQLQRPNAMCPRCYSLERHRLIWLYLKNKTNFFSADLKVLHFAPERCLQKTFKSMHNLDYIGADLEPQFGMIKIDIMNIPYEDNYFNVILCSHVLNEVTDDRKAISELFRVLKPGGWAIIQVTIDNRVKKTIEKLSASPEETRHFFTNPNNIRVYGKDYKDRLEKTGFIVKVDEYVKELGEDMIKKYGLIKDEEIYFCSKPMLESKIKQS